MTYFKHESAYVDEGAQIGDGSKIWHFSHVQSGAQLGENCILGQNVNVGANVKIGKNVKIQNNVSVYEGVELEDGVFCGPSMVFTNVIFPRSEYPQRGNFSRTLVRAGATLGANSTIVCGTTIGQCAFIGAGAVVTKDVPDFALVVGSPSRRIGCVSRGGIKLQFDAEGNATCPKSGRHYKLDKDRVVEI